MHRVRDGAFWDDAPKPVDTGENYDLVIVGGGISGLASAHYYRKMAGDKARILILRTTMILAATRSATNLRQRMGCASDLGEHTPSKVPRPTAQSLKG